MITLDDQLVREKIAAGDWLGALWTLSNERRPDLIEHMLAVGMGGSAELADVLRECWESDHDLLRARFGSRRLIKLFRSCRDAPRFAHPFVAPLRIYRGERLSYVMPAPRSWTIEPQLACWFATLYRGGLPDPIVVTGIVHPRDILLATNDRNEAEIVPARIYGRRIWSADLNELMRHAVIWQCTRKDDHHPSRSMTDD